MTIFITCIFQKVHKKEETVGHNYASLIGNHGLI